MSDQVKAIYTMLFPLIAAINLLLASFGIKPFEDSKLNAMVMVVSVLVVLVGFIYNHFKHPTTTPTTVVIPPTLPLVAAPGVVVTTPAPPLTAADIQKTYDEITSGRTKDVSTI